MAFSNNDKLDMLEVYFLSNKNCTLAANAYQERYPERPIPSRKLFSTIVRNLRDSGSFVKKRERRPTALSEEKTIDILAYFEANPTASIREVARLSEVSIGSIVTILQRYKYHPYKTVVLHGLLPGDEGRRLTFCAWLLDEAIRSPNIIKNIIWSDESNFSNNGMFNRKNNHYWSTENPLAVREGHNQVRFSVNCWCALLNNRVLAVHFYNGTLRGPRYIEFLQNILINALEDICCDQRLQLFFQQDGAPPHNCQGVQEFLNTHFPGKWIATDGPILWPARSPDLTPMDYFLWGYLKNNVYKCRFLNVQELTIKITQVLNSINHNMLSKATRDVFRRAHACVYTDGHHFEHLL